MNIKQQANNFCDYEQAIFNFNQLKALEIQNLGEFLDFVQQPQTQKILQAQNGKKTNKIFLDKLKNDKFFWTIKNNYATLGGDLILHFVNRCADGKRIVFDNELKKYIERIEHNNYLHNDTFYFGLAKNDKSNAIFDFDKFCKEIERLQQHLEHIKTTLTNQKQRLEQAIKLNNELYNLLLNDDFVRAIFEK